MGISSVQKRRMKKPDGWENAVAVGIPAFGPNTPV